MRTIWVSAVVLFLFSAPGIGSGAAPVSEDTESCLECHASLHPGIVEGWRKSRHASTSPAEGLKRPKRERRISSEKVDVKWLNTAVGCAECHTLNPESHNDGFEHNEYRVHTVVTPADCGVCHAQEAAQYRENLMSHAHGNLMGNPLYTDLANQINGIQTLKGEGTVLQGPDPETQADSCLYCHGTEVKVLGFTQKETDMGTMTLPVLAGWPNHGVGRINPDGTMGSCGACHTRHEFAIAMARKPYTCSECHKGPDVPAYPVYQVSKHGNVMSAFGDTSAFDPVPWTIGKDITAPTCATCHVSLIQSSDGTLLAERTHRMNDRLPWRLLGLIYAHPHPKSPDTTAIRNKAGLPLPTELGGEPVSEYLIDKTEQGERLARMKGVCLSCHSAGWVEGHFRRFENTLETTNRMTLTATQIVTTAWEKGLAKGPAEKDSPFNEAIERKWVEQWLFFANSTRLASAMAGADYGVFANGRWSLSKNVQEMLELIGRHSPQAK